jgi:carboxypeptidase PM20D1
MAHLDVVPVETGTEDQWTHPPFSGEIADGFIWGRGSMDIKEGVVGILEAVELLLKEGFQPRRTVYLAFGHDEEIGGSEGARVIADELKRRISSLEYVLDEGGSITEGIVPGMESPVALVGIAEKGYVSLELSVESEGGHSSMPPPETAIGILSAALIALERHQMPASFSGVINRLFAHIGPEMNFVRKLVFANTWLFSPFIVHKLAQSPYTNAMIRTTTAPTIVQGGTKENILPKKATCVVNFRILPGDTVASVTDHVKTVIDDPRITIRPLKQSWNPSMVSDDAGECFQTLHKTINQIFPDVMVAPFLVTGATDSRHYVGISKNIFKFVPFMASREDLKRVHGTDERISIEDYEQCIRFYVQFIRNSTS